MKILTSALAVTAMGLAATAAQAGVIVHDEASEFSDITVVQGTLRNGDPITDTSRTDFGAVFDDDPSTFFSVGFGGRISLTIDPSNRAITDGSVIEVTFPGRDSHAEALAVYLGTDSSPFANLIGYFLNSDANAQLGGTGPGVIDSGAGIATLSFAAIAGNEGGRYTIADVVGSFNTISFLDASGVASSNLDRSFPGQTDVTSTDGFEIGELSVTSVPEPGSLALLGAGLAGLGLVRRRRAAA